MALDADPRLASAVLGLLRQALEGNEKPVNRCALILGHFPPVIASTNPIIAGTAAGPAMLNSQSTSAPRPHGGSRSNPDC
jgi:hypothetical protein